MITQLTKIMSDDILLCECEISWTLELTKVGGGIQVSPKILTEKVMIPRLDDDGEVIDDEIMEFKLNKFAGSAIFNPGGENFPQNVQLDCVFVDLEANTFSALFDIE